MYDHEMIAGVFIVPYPFYSMKEVDLKCVS